MDRTAFENLRVYRLAEETADLAWEVVVEWTRLAQFSPSGNKDAAARADKET